MTHNAPYPGLRPYHEDEQGKFFGRDVDAEILLDKVLTNRLTLLFAASGVGKSSLLQAAVIPRLKSPTGENLEVVYHIDWVSEPVSSVRAAVLQALHASGKLPEGAADDAGETLAELLEFCGLFVRHPLVLILDQFEEFFRYQRATASFQPFIEQLTAVITNPQLPASLVLSMREDFALELNAFKQRLPTILFENFYRLEKLGRVGAREAIVTPVEQVGFQYEPVLLETLLDDLLSRELDRLPHSPVVDLLETVEPPYLQIVCAQLWELNKTNPDKLLRLVTYEKAGKAKGILSNYLTGVLQSFTLAEKQLASKAFDHLASQRGVKMAYTAAALAETVRVNEAALGKVLEKLAAVRILRSQQRGDTTWYELYHDMFSGSIESWNSAWKDKMRRRKFSQVASAGVVSIAALFAGWDYYVNATNYQLRISPKQGISDQIELWQGKPESFDLFHQQHYLAETDFQRHEIEPDKQFNQKLVADYGGLQTELTGSLPIDQRITAYSKKGNFKEALKLAKESIIPQNIELAKRVLPHLADISVPNSERMIYNILETSRSSVIREEITGIATTQNKIFLSGNVLMYDKHEITKDMSIDEKDFWATQLPTKIVNLFAREKIMSLYYDRTEAQSLRNSPNSHEARSFLLNTFNKENIANISFFESLGQLQVKDAKPRLIETLKNYKHNDVGWVAETLAQLQARETIPLLINALENEDGIANDEVIKSLTHLKAKEAIPNLTKIIQHKNGEINHSALESLHKLNAKNLIDIYKKLLNNKNILIRKSIIEELGKIKNKNTESILVELLKDNDTQDSAIIALGELKTKKAIPELLNILKSNHNRSPAAKAMGQLKVKESIPDLLNLIKNGERSELSSAAISLGQMKVTDAIPDLSKLLENENGDVRSAAIQSLAQLNTKDFTPEFINFLKDEDTETRTSAAEALGQLYVNSATPELLSLLKDTNGDVRISVTNSLGNLRAKETIPNLLNLLKDWHRGVASSAARELASLNIYIMPNLFSVMGERGYNDGLPNLESASRIASGELLDFLLCRLKNGDSRIRQSATIAALRMERGNNLNEIQKNLLHKATSLVDQQTRDAAVQQLTDEDRQEAEEKARQLPINQPGLETKPLTLDELKAKLDTLDQAYTNWREHRDAEAATDNETDKLADLAPFIYEYAYAIANMDEAEGIKLLGHNLAKVREAAARGLANSDFLGVPLLQKLEQEWLATDNPITRQGLFHAIDIALLAMEGIGADKELEALKAYEPTLTNEHSAASIKPRVEWTRIQLQWRVDALKELKELADRQLPGLLKEYCLNPDGTDMKPEECTIER